MVPFFTFIRPRVEGKVKTHYEKLNHYKKLPTPGWSGDFH